jgi:TolA-binding protein
MTAEAASPMDHFAMEPKSKGSGAGSGSLPQLPEWVAWLQLGLTALLAVLFLAMLAKARQQGSRIQELQDRVEGLENTRALERTTGLEEQLRTTVERLQEVERSTARINVLSADNEALRNELGQLRRSRPEAAPPPRATAPATTPSDTGPSQPLAPPPLAPPISPPAGGANASP